MARYSAKKITVPVAADVIASKFSDLTAFQGALEQLPAAVREKIGGLRFEKDALVIDTPQLGAVTLKVTDRTPSRIAFTAVGSPVPLVMGVDLTPSGDSTEMATAIDVEIPAMLRPLIGSKMQEAADKFGEMMGNLASKA